MSREDVKITLEAARVMAGYTQAEAARQLGVAPSTLASWESNSTKLSYLEANRLAKLYGIEPDLLFFGKRNDFIRNIRKK